jgi:HD-GYP domain
MKVNLFEFLLCITNAQDLASHQFYNHHQQVAYLSFQLAKELNMPIERQKEIFLAALVHDIGALSVDERMEIIEREPITVNNHGFVGAKLFSKFKPLANEARIIKFHHIPWNYGEGMTYQGEEVPLGSHVIHLADRICTVVLPNNNVLSGIPPIMEHILRNEKTKFNPYMVEAMLRLAEKEYIWLDLISTSPINKIDTSIFGIIDLEIDDILEIAMIFSQIIDFRSKFTARHSAGVANTAETLAKLLGFSHQDCKKMLVAGYLHDLGKLAIGSDILEKPGALTEDEFNQMRTHTYYSYRLLQTITQFQTINEWASYHHERLNGKGYPFHLKADRLSTGSRIMAVADVFTAIREDRPYRKGMEDNETKRVLQNMVDRQSLDGEIVEVLLDHFDEIDELRKMEQELASKRYYDFMIMKENEF